MTWARDSRVRSAMISDSLDVLGVRNNAMSVHVKALRPHMRAVGLAATVQFVADSQYDQKDPYGDGIDFLDTLKPGEVAVVATGSSAGAAENLSRLDDQLGHPAERDGLRNRRPERSRWHVRCSFEAEMQRAIGGDEWVW